MYICICKAVSRDDLLKQLKSEEPTLEKVQSSCGAGTDCGACTRKVVKLIEEHVPKRSSGNLSQKK